MSSRKEVFNKIRRLPPYALAEIVEMKTEARRKGEDIIDMGMGNPDLATPAFIVDKLKEAVDNPKNHRYSASRGIAGLRRAICDLYRRRYGVELDPGEHAVATIGAKEGMSHLVLAMLDPGDTVLVPDPTYPIHNYCVVIAGGDVHSVPLNLGEDFFERLLHAYQRAWPRPKLMILSFPANPTTVCVDLEFFSKVVDFAREHEIRVIHDLAYSDLAYDGYRPPSFLQVPGAIDLGVEFFSMSKSYSMPGWRVGYCVGNPEMVHALTRIKSYLDYGIFQPIQIAAAVALNSGDEDVREIVGTYEERRNVLCDGLTKIGWDVPRCQATQFVWARLPESHMEKGSMEFGKLLLSEAKVAVSPGVGFGDNGEGFVRFALVENTQRIQQAIRGIKRVL
jgi:alanine-synthesizing transaminase